MFLSALGDQQSLSESSLLETFASKGIENGSILVLGNFADVNGLT
jgi:hypothetical protein